MSRRQHFFSSARSTDQNFHYVLERGPGEECKDAICFYQALPGPGRAISLRGPRGRLNAPFFETVPFIRVYTLFFPRVYSWRAFLLARSNNEEEWSFSAVDRGKTLRDFLFRGDSRRAGLSKGFIYIKPLYLIYRVDRNLNWKNADL